MSSRAAIFDLDGTVVDNIGFHVEAWLAFCKRHHVQVEAQRFFTEFNGKKNDEILLGIFGRPVVGDELSQMADEKETLYRELYKPKLKPAAGLKSLLRTLRQRKVRCAIATAAPRANRDFVLQGLGLEHFFDALVGSEQVKRGKPAPDIFLAAADALSVRPTECLVFEDAVNGIAAARAAGMRSIGLSTTASPEMLRKEGAEAVIANFEQLDPLMIDWLAATASPPK